MNTKIIPCVTCPVKLPTNNFSNLFHSESNVEIAIKFHYRSRKKGKWLTDALRGNNNELDDESLHRVIDSWKCDKPVIISAQTGCGKNTFIMQVLIKKMFSETGYRRKILILSNRIALGRQNKLHFLKFLSKLTNSSYIEKISETLTEVGLDKHFNFEFVTICSYQQIYNLNIRKDGNLKISLQEYQYIICDECQFFTSDAVFNPHTDEILNYIADNGKNAVRIYMSSTIEDCFEPILRAEIKQNEEIFAKEKATLQEKIFPNSVEKFNMSIGIANGNYGYNNLSELLDNRQQNIESEIEKRRENLKMTVNFYHVSRNYAYIDNITEYLNLQDIFEVLLKKK